jgi:hypothetical protein
MSSFAAVQAPTFVAASSAEVIAQEWFPSVDIAHVRKAVRLTGTVTDERLYAALVRSMDEVNRALAAWASAYTTAGIASFAEVPAPKIGGESINVHHYRDAVYYLARADLMETYRDMDATREGVQKAEELEPSVDSDRRVARNALNDIRGTARMSVELV